MTLLPVLSARHEQARNRRMQTIAEEIAARCDVALFPLCFMPSYRLRVPSIVSFHDLQHETFPQFFSWRSLRARRVLFGATFRHASVMQASSLAMKHEALRVYGDRLLPDRIAVIPEGVEYSLFAATADADARALYGLPEEFLFYPAQLWHHKNHMRLLQALDALADSGLRIPLVLTGAEYEAGPAVRQFIADRGFAKQVFVLGKVPFGSLLSLYQQATYVISASLHESNCLPLLEAAASGTPILAADIPANRETAAIFRLPLFDPLDIGNIVSMLESAWHARHDQSQAVAQNRDTVRRFDWAGVADLYMGHAQALLEHRQ
jgi:glycosyltransferase involved in cell wall biosynthesis